MKHTILLLVGFCLPFVGSAQTVLPDLAPQEVEIRGELTISFPSLRRQALIGFNPPPRVPDIDVRRMPYVEAYKQQGAVLPQNPLGLPVAPTALPRPSGQGFSGTAEAGFGRYAARYALIEASLLTTRRSRWTLNAGYTGTSSFSPFGSDVAANGLRGATRYSVAGRKIGFGLEVQGASDGYTLYGVSDPGSSGALSAPDRVRNDFSGTLWIGSGTSNAVRFKSSLTVYSGDVSTKMFDDRTDPRTRQSDSGGEISLDLQAGRLEIDGYAGQMSLASTLSGRAVGDFDAGGNLRLDFGTNQTLHIGARIMGFEANPDATKGVRRALTYLTPVVRYEAALAPNIRVEVSQNPGIESARPSTLFRTSPFLVDEPHIEPVLNVVDARARVRGFWTTFQASGFASFKQSPNWRVIEHDETTFAGYSRGLSSVFHTKARTLAAGGELRFSPSPGFEARIGGQVQDGRMTDLGADIPYFPTWTASGMLSAAFSNGSGLVQLTSRVLGPRSRDRARTAEVPTYVDLDVRVSYSITRKALLAIELRNVLGDAPYWDHYPEAPGTILLGLGWRW